MWEDVGGWEDYGQDSTDYGSDYGSWGEYDQPDYGNYDFTSTPSYNPPSNNYQSQPSDYYSGEHASYGGGGSNPFSNVPSPSYQLGQTPSSASVFGQRPGLVSRFADWVYRNTVGQTPGEMINAVRTPATSGPLSIIQQTYPNQIDKQLHAWSSHQLANRYGQIPSFIFGGIKELFDFPMGEAEYGDLIANMLGINLSGKR